MGVAIHLIKPGRYPQEVITAEYLREVAESYDPSVHEAPIVVGHKSNDERARSGEPAHGWIKRLWVDPTDDSLWGEAEQISDFFKESHKKGTLKKRSAELYRSLKEAGGKKYLKAVALLGAAAPAVKGLKPVVFNDGDSAVIAILSEEPMSEGLTKNDLDGLGDKIVNGIKGIFGRKEKGDDPVTLSDVEIEDVINKIGDDGTKQDINDLLDACASNERIAEVATERANQSREAALSERAKDPNRKYRVTRIKQDIAAKVDGWIKAGKLTPAAKDAGVLVFMEHLAHLDGDEETVKFSEKGDAMSPLSFFENLIEKHSTGAPNGTAVPKGDDNDGDGEKTNSLGMNLNFSENAERRSEEMIDTDRLNLAEKANLYARKNKIAFRDALIEISRSK